MEKEKVCIKPKNKNKKRCKAKWITNQWQPHSSRAKECKYYNMKTEQQQSNWMHFSVFILAHHKIANIRSRTKKQETTQFFLNKYVHVFWFSLWRENSDRKQTSVKTKQNKNKKKKEETRRKNTTARDHTVYYDCGVCLGLSAYIYYIRNAARTNR